MNHFFLRKMALAFIAIISTFSLGFGQCGGLYIAGVIDGPLTGGIPKGITVCASATVLDMSIYGLGSANNGGGTDGQEYTFPAVCLEAGDCVFIASETGGPTSFFGCAPFDITGTSGAASINGDDAIELFCNGTVEDLFGDINVDGSGTCWDHLDGWAVNNLGMPNFGAFSCANWSFSGTNALDGETLNMTAATPYPLDPCPTYVEPPTCGVTMSGGPTAVCTDITVNLTGGVFTIDPQQIAGGSTCDGAMPEILLSQTEITCADLFACSSEIGILVAAQCNGQTSLCIAGITVINQTGPTLDCMDATVTLDGNGDGSLSSIVSATACLGTADIELSRSLQFDCEDVMNSPVTVEVIGTDECGNFSTCTATITVLDVLPPVIFCPADKTLTLAPGQCGDFNIQPTPVVTDNCGFTVTASDDPGFVSVSCNVDCDGPAMGPATTYSFVAVDGSGNEATCEYTVTLQDFTPATEALSCNDAITITANLDCDFSIEPQLLLEGETGCFTCLDVSTEELHTTTALAEFRVTITDPCTEVSCWGIVTVEDKTDPTLECTDCTDPNITDPDCILNCTELPLFTTLNRNNGVLGYDEGLLDDLIPTDRGDFVDDFVTEACGAPISADFFDTVTPSESCEGGTVLQRTWTVTFTRPDGSVGTLGCERFYRFDPIPAITITDEDGNLTGVEAPVDENGAPITENDEAAGIIVEDVILMPRGIVNIPTCNVGSSPAAIAAFFDNPLTVDQDTNDDNVDPDEFDIDCVIENNEGVFMAYPHFYIQGIRPDGPHAQPIIDGICNVNLNFTDTQLSTCAPGCSGNQKLLRTWTVLDWCTNEFFDYSQIINVIDSAPPSFVVEPVVASVDPAHCTADIALPAPDKLTDTCDDNLTYSIGFVEGNLAVSGNAEDGYILHDAPIGETTVQYLSEDCCNNIARVVTTVTVSDNTPPVPVTIQDVVIELTGTGTPGQGVDGTAKLFVSDIDNGSFDGCTDVIVDMRRSPVCSDEDAEWGEFVSFCCEDLGGAESVQIDVEVRVRDWNDNVTTIWSTVTLEDKAGGSGTCPPDVVISCTDDLWDFDVTGGTPRTFNTCMETTVAVDTLQVFEDTERRRKNANDGGPTLGIFFGVRVEEFDASCGFGAFRRDFDNCEQWIVVAPFSVDGELLVTIDDEGRFVVPSGFDGSTIDFPADIEVDCDVFDAGEPTFMESACNLVGFTVETEEFGFEQDACQKIVNTWTVIDWCAFDPTDPDLNPIDDVPGPGEEFDRFIHDSGMVEGRYQHSQVIKVIDTEAPEVTSDNNLCFAATEECGSKGLTLSATGLDNGICSSAWLSWEADLDLFADWAIDRTFSSNVPAVLPNGEPNPDYIAKTTNGSAVTIGIPDGIRASKSQHRVEWRLFDGCGNLTSLTTYFTIEDKKAPTPVCLNLGTAVMDNGQVELWAVDFDNKSFDNCSSEEEIFFTFTDVPPPPRCDEEYDSNTQLMWYNTTFWYFDSSEIDDDVQECGVTGAGEYMNIEDYGGDVHQWIPALRSTGKIFTTEDVSPNGTLDVPIYVWDRHGNVDFCRIELTVIDNGGGASAGIVAGTVTTETAQRVDGVETSLVSNHPTYPRTDMTELDGRFEFSDNDMSRDYEVSGIKDGDDNNGVSTIDLVRIQRHILGVDLLDSPYKMIAADVNGDQRINGQDLVELRKLILGIYSELPENDSWMILNADSQLDINNPWAYDLTRNINDLSLDMINEDFIGVKIGDVDNDVEVGLQSAGQDVGKVISLNTPMGYVTAGDEVTLSLSTEVGLSGYQFTLETGMELVEVSGIGEDRVGVHSGAITVSENLTEVQTGELMSITLRATESGSVSQMLDMTSSITNAEAYVGTELEKVGLTLNGVIESGYSLGQNEPNPFSAETVISYTLPEAGAVTMTMMDVTGKILREITEQGVAGRNEIKLSKEGLGGGVIYYRLQAGDYVATKHMIVIE